VGDTVNDNLQQKKDSKVGGGEKKQKGRSIFKKREGIFVFTMKGLKKEDQTLN